jgi:hypothetical protein
LTRGDIDGTPQFGMTPPLDRHLTATVLSGNGLLHFGV